LPLLIFGVLAVVLAASVAVSYTRYGAPLALGWRSPVDVVARLSSMVSGRPNVQVAQCPIAADSAVINALRTPDRPAPRGDQGDERSRHACR
jgi:hypothetical protein